MRGVGEKRREKPRKRETKEERNQGRDRDQGLMKKLNDLKKKGAEITFPKAVKQQSAVAKCNMPKKRCQYHGPQSRETTICRCEGAL